MYPCVYVHVCAKTLDALETHPHSVEEMNEHCVHIIVASEMYYLMAW